MRSTFRKLFQPLWDQHVEDVLKRYGHSVELENALLRKKNNELQLMLSQAKKELENTSAQNPRDFPQMQCTVSGCKNIRFQGGLCIEHHNIGLANGEDFNE